MTERATRRLLRAIGLGIAVLGAIDPPVTSRRAVRPVVVVQALDSADSRLARDVAAQATRAFTVARKPEAGASAVVLVGDRLPADNDALAVPTFAVIPDSTLARITIERLEVPDVAPTNTRIPVRARVAVRGARDRAIDVTLRAASVADRARRRVVGTDTTFDVDLSVVASGEGVMPIRVTAALSGDSASADAAVDVRDRRWRVLSFDLRPSWTSTFVRRAVERDPMFSVAARVVTSRGISTATGDAPMSLTDARMLYDFDAIVVGAPDALRPADADALEAFMRRRGGSVILLLDGGDAGAVGRLTGVAQWDSASKTTVVRDDSTTLLGSESMWPRALPPAASAVGAASHPVVWETPVGAGRLIVSGLLDAWRYRDSTASGFSRYWRTLIASAANDAAVPVAVDLPQRIVAPGEPVDVRVTLRDAFIAPSTAARSATVVGEVVWKTPNGENRRVDPMTYWPAGGVGEVGGETRASRSPGTLIISATSGNQRGEARVLVADGVRRAAPRAPDLLSAWADASGGSAIGGADLDALVPALVRKIHPPDVVVTWHPMRNPWWLVPFVLALAGEWWMRRRRGLA
jgi:hypothetical protein